MASEQFDAVLAEMRDRFDDDREAFDEFKIRLAAAHAAEVAERDATVKFGRAANTSARAMIERLQLLASNQHRLLKMHHVPLPADYELPLAAAALLTERDELRARAEAAERDARRLRELLRQASDYVRIAADEEASLNTHKVPEAHRTVEAKFFAEINAAIDACMGAMP